MKQIPLLQGKALLIELPEGAKDLDIFKAHYGQQLMYTDRFDCGFTIDLPDGNWQIVGMLSEVTEEQAAGIVAKHYSSLGYDDYLHDVDFSVLDTALESLESAILTEGWYFQHPQGDTPLYYTDRFTGEQKIRADWEYGLSRVFDRSRCLLLGREI